MQCSVLRRVHVARDLVISRLTYLHFGVSYDFLVDFLWDLLRERSCNILSYNFF